MNALTEVLTIAIGTAVLAAIIVAADWDLAAIRIWQTLNAPNRRAHDSLWSDSAHDRWQPSWTAVHDEPGRACDPLAVDHFAAPGRRTEADEWLAAAAAHRLPELARFGHQWDDNLTAPPAAAPLRDVLAARLNEPRGEAEAAAEAA